MFTIEDIQTIVQRFYVKDDRVYARNIDQEIVDEEAVVPIKAAYLIFNEAEIRYKGDLQLLGAKYVSSREKYLEKMMERFSVNGEENDLGQNKLIRDLVASDGKYEELISSDGLDAKFSIFMEPKKSFGLAYLRLKLRETGYDTEDIELSYDTANLKDTGTAKLFITFKKKPYVDEDEISSNDTSFEYRFAYDELNKAIEHNKVERIDYWSNFLKQWKKAKMVNDAERIDYLKGIVDTVIKDIEERRKKRREETSSEKEIIVNNLSDVTSPIGIATIKEEPKKSVEERVISNKKLVDEPSVVEKPKVLNSLLDRFDVILSDIERKKRRATSSEVIKAVYYETRTAMKICDIDVFSPFWQGLSDEEKEFAARLMMKASALLDDRMRYNHWISIHEDMLKVLGRPSEILDKTPLTTQDILSRFEILLARISNGEKPEDGIDNIKKYGETCEKMWKTMKAEEKELCAKLMKISTKLLNDEVKYNYWVGVYDVLSSKIGENNSDK